MKTRMQMMLTLIILFSKKVIHFCNVTNVDYYGWFDNYFEPYSSTFDASK